jgi:putative DNA primase/helicase
MLKLAQSIPGIACTANDFDKVNYYFNLKNGTYDLRANKLIEHDPDHLISKISDTNFNPDATCVSWLSALFTYFDDDVEQVKFIQKICGLTLCGEHLEEVVFFLYGLGKNGKSVFIKVLEMIYGDYSQKAPVEMLLLNNNDSSIPNDVARLKGARFVVTSELPKGKRLNENRIKDLSGGDKITARFLHKEFFEFRPSCKIWIYGNHKPMVHGNDEGIWRRIILIPFLVTIPEEDRKPANELQEMFEAEKEGILNWMIEGWKLYQREGLNPPESVKEATQAYREEQDILLDFIRECCDISSTVNRVYAKDLHNAYIKWCDENKETVIKSKSFYLILEEKGFKRQESSHGNKKEFLGISIKSDLF